MIIVLDQIHLFVKHIQTVMHKKNCQWFFFWLPFIAGGGKYAKILSVEKTKPCVFSLNRPSRRGGNLKKIKYNKKKLNSTKKK